jgi:hypothetical protein
MKSDLNDHLSDRRRELAVDRPELHVCEECGHAKPSALLAGYCCTMQGPPCHDCEEEDEDEEDRTCRGCGDVVSTLSSDNLCDGCVAEEAGNDEDEDAGACENCGSLSPWRCDCRQCEECGREYAPARSAQLGTPDHLEYCSPTCQNAGRAR